jgi:serine/threonine protein phosphatase PrpC
MYHSSPIVMLQAEMSTAKTFSLAGGEVVYFTNRSPDKETKNEDTLAIIPTSDSSGVLALADGCGGEVMGKEAAAIAIQAIVDLVARSANPALVRTAILDGFELATQQVAKLGGGAATTLIVVEINGNQLRTFHVGDSQAMLVGGRGKVKFITLAHSPVSFAQEAGFLTEDEAIGHADRNIISNALGAEGTYIDVGLPRSLAIRDTLVMGSDGLYDNLTVGEIVDLVRRGSIDEAAEKTRQAVGSRMRGGQPDTPCKPDDFTVMLFRRSKKIATASLHERAG